MPSISSIPGYQHNEYLLILKPHEELWNRIIKIKEEFAVKYNAPIAKVLRTHIALVSFNAWAIAEEKFIQRLQYIAMSIPPIKVELSNFGSFPSHTIYINVTTKITIQNIVKQIKQAQHLLKTTNEHKPNFIEEPHISIARKLKPWQYEKAWLEYSTTHFTGRFIADCMLLLKRPASGGNYQILRRFEFQNLPVATKQGSLFM